MKNSACSSLVVSLEFLALLATAAFGQQNKPNKSNPDVSRVPREIQGCLNGANGNFTLETETGVVYQVKGDNSILSQHTGQQVDVVGTEIVSTPSSLPAKSNPQADANQTAAPEPIAPPAFQVSKVVKMKDKCYRPR
ncbi:MAG: hypothetical protein JWO91_679 [Acidobacteriaceae bacterium]|jgi:hypothetical protein|nr:hypothetical protein [Acidobacteriaceae bacterium]